MKSELVKIKSKRLKNGTWRYLLLLVGVSILFILMYYVGFDKLAESLLDVNLKYVLIAAVFLGGVVALKGVRWQLLFNRLRFLNSLKIYFIGQAVNEIAPTGSGELAQVFIASKRYGVQKRVTLISAIMNRFCDIVYLVVMASLGVFWIEGVSASNIVIPIALMVMFGMFLFKPQAIGAVRGFLRAIQIKILLKLSAYLKRFQDALTLYNRENKWEIVGGLVLTVGAWILDGLSHLCLIRAFGCDISMLNLLIVIAVAWFLGTFSFLPGGLGAREGVYVYLLGLQGIAPAVGLSAILIQRLLLYSYFFPGALVSIFSHRRK